MTRGWPLVRGGVVRLPQMKEKVAGLLLVYGWTIVVLIGGSGCWGR